MAAMSEMITGRTPTIGHVRQFADPIAPISATARGGIDLLDFGQVARLISDASGRTTRTSCKIFTLGDDS